MACDGLAKTGRVTKAGWRTAGCESIPVQASPTAYGVKLRYPSRIEGEGEGCLGGR